MEAGSTALRLSWGRGRRAPLVCLEDVTQAAFPIHAAGDVGRNDDSRLREFPCSWRDFPRVWPCENILTLGREVKYSGCSGFSPL